MAGRPACPCCATGTGLGLSARGDRQRGWQGDTKPQAAAPEPLQGAAPLVCSARTHLAQSPWKCSCTEAEMQIFVGVRGS